MFKSQIKTLITPFLDPHYFHLALVQRKISLARAFNLTWRYRLAGAGFSLTENEKRLSQFRNKHEGQRCFIIGNGPSLNSCDLTKLKDEVTFGVNAIYLNREKMGFDPTYYLVEDELVAEDRSKEIVKYQGPTQKFFGEHLRRFLGNDEKAIWYNCIMNYRDYPDFPHFGKTASTRTWAGGTVTYQSLQLAYFMGFSQVYMVGFDHNYVIPTEHIVEGVRITSTTDDPNHFHPDYFGKGYRWHDPAVHRMEASYIRAKEVFEADGRSIYNATVGGQLEVFPRVNYDDALQ